MGDWKYVTDGEGSVPSYIALLREKARLFGIHRHTMTQAEAVAFLAEPDAQEIREARAPNSWDRILWNRRPKNVSDVGDIDEIVAHNVTVHIEQMDDRCWWIGITWPDGSSWDGNFHATKKGEMTFGQQGHRDGGWPSDEEHEQ